MLPNGPEKEKPFMAMYSSLVAQDFINGELLFYPIQIKALQHLGILEKQHKM